MITQSEVLFLATTVTLFAARILAERICIWQVTDISIDGDRIRRGNSWLGRPRLIKTVCYFLALIDIWASVLSAAVISKYFSNIFVMIVISLFCAGRFRALQEVSHYGIHGIFGKTRSWQWTLANLSFHFPLCRPSAARRFKSHVRDHHPYANQLGLDPNVQDFVMAGWGSSNGPSFLRFILFPLTPVGLVKEVLTIKKEVLNNGALHLFMYLVAIVVLCYTINFLGDYRAVIYCYVIPRMFIYPLLAWWSQIFEHRWFASCKLQRTRDREFLVGHRLALRGISMIFVKYYVCPFGDYFHLAHSLYPNAAWFELGVIDRVEAAHSCRYVQHSKIRIFDTIHPEKGILSDLQTRFE